MNEFLQVNQLTKTYKNGADCLRAIDRVSFAVRQGECVGLVGESGCGKSTLVRQLLALESPDSGEIRFLGRSLTGLSHKMLRQLRQHMQVVFQNSTAALNDRLPIWRSVMEPIDNYPQVQPVYFDRAVLTRREQAARLLTMVGLDAEQLDLYPHELSGGQRQRVCIARSISLCPQLLICDEPTSSLDMTTQSQILLLLKQLQRELNMSVLFISHDPAAVMQLCQRVLVMREGRIVDEFQADELGCGDRHPYTRVLISAAQ